jgi:FixJ family two-component response regulator
LVIIVAGDAQARRSLTARVKGLGLAVKLCHSAEEFFVLVGPAGGGCILLDVSQPAADLELLRRLGPAEVHLPVVAISDRASVPTAVEAMKLGARDFLEASCPDRRLAKALDDGLRWEAEHRRQIALVERIRRRRDLLKPGCRQVLDLIVAGRSNCQMAEELDLSVRAVEERRGKVMRTMRARSLAELVRLALTAEGGGPSHRQRPEWAGIGG